MKRKFLSILSLVFTTAILLFCLASCGEGGKSAASINKGEYPDGTYTGRSADHSEDESGVGAGYAEVKIEIKDNSVVSCDFTMFELDGTVKDIETYGSQYSDANRRKAQKAVQAGQKYAESLVEAGNLSGDGVAIDAISGATITYSEFIESVNDALSSAAG